MTHDIPNTPDAGTAKPRAPAPAPQPSTNGIASAAPGRPGTIEWIALLIAAGVLIAFRLHAFDLPLETDECNYAYTGGRLLAGDRLYVDVWDHQPFGIFVLFSALIALVGDAPEVFRWSAVACSLVSLGLIFSITRRLCGPWAATCAAITFAIVSSDPGTAGEGCNREIFMNAFVLAAWWVACRRSGSTRHLFVAGALLAVGSTIKTVLAVHWILLALWAITRTSRVRSDTSAHSGRWRRLTALSAGPVLVWGLSLLYFAATGRAGAFLDAAFRFNLGYSGSSEGFFTRFVRFFNPVRHPFLFDSAWPLWVLLVPAAGWLLWSCVAKRQRGSAPIAALVVASYLATCLPGRFWPHYYYLMIPPAVIAASSFMGSLMRIIQERHPQGTGATPGGALRYAPMLIPLLLPILLTRTQYTHYLSQSPYGITVPRYNSRDFWARAQGDRVRSVTRPTDKIFVYGHDTGIYYYAQRRCASRFTMITGLRSGYPGVQARRDTLLRELQEARPRVIMVLFDEPPFPGWTEFLGRHYGPAVGVDYHDKTGEPILAVFARTDDPIKPIDWDWDREEVGGW